VTSSSNLYLFPGNSSSRSNINALSADRDKNANDGRSEFNFETNNNIEGEKNNMRLTQKLPIKKNDDLENTIK